MARRKQRRSHGRWLLLAVVGLALFGLGLYSGGERLSERWGAFWAKRPAAVKSAPAPRGENRPRRSPTAPAAERAPEAPARVVPAPGPAPVARLAFLIDDLGARVEDVDRLLALALPLSYAVLPYEAQTRQVAARLAARGAEVLCHLPMAAERGEDPGRGALTLGMSAGEIARATAAALDAVPGAVGINNHMGSLLTADAAAMRAMLGVAAERDLFFVDSRTTPDSLAERVAREVGVPTAARDVFLDAERDAPSLAAELERLLALATERGAAIAIAHPHRASLELLERELPRLKARGFELVPVSYLLEREETLPE